MTVKRYFLLPLLLLFAVALLCACAAQEKPAASAVTDTVIIPGDEVSDTDIETTLSFEQTVEAALGGWLATGIAGQPEDETVYQLLLEVTPQKNVYTYILRRESDPIVVEAGALVWTAYDLPTLTWEDADKTEFSCTIDLRLEDGRLCLSYQAGDAPVQLKTGDLLIFDKQSE